MSHRKHLLSAVFNLLAAGGMTVGCVVAFGASHHPVLGTISALGAAATLIGVGQSVEKYRHGDPYPS